MGGAVPVVSPGTRQVAGEARAEVCPGCGAVDAVDAGSARYFQPICMGMDLVQVVLGAPETDGTMGIACRRR